MITTDYYCNECGSLDKSYHYPSCNRSGDGPPTNSTLERIAAALERIADALEKKP